MPWNGTGNFNRTDGARSGVQTWALAAAAGENVRSDRADTHDQDIADGLENCVTRDGQNSPTANLPMATRRHTGVGNAEARTDYAAAGQVQDGILSSLSVAGTDTLTATPSPVIPAYVLGQRFSFKIANTNTGAVTLNISALGAKAIVKAAGAALAAGDLAAGDMAEVIYDGTRFQLVAVSVAPVALRDIGTAEGDVAELEEGGVFNTARIPDLSADKITSDTFDADRIPDLSAAKITSGTLSSNRLPTVPISKGGTGATTVAAALEALGARTALFTHITNNPHWVAASGTVTFTVPDIDSYAYITIDIKQRPNTTSPWAYRSATIKRSDIPTDTSPGAGGSDVGMILDNQATTYLTVGRNSNGDRLYLKPQSNIYGQVPAIWGGDF